jgi:microcystin-dependent protein
MGDPFLGQMMQVAFNFAPINWALAQGQTVSVAQNTALFSLLGTNFGGNGTTTFQFPDVQGRVMVGAGNGIGLSPIFVGEKAGAQNITLTVGNLPSHTHVATYTPPTTAIQALTSATGQLSVPVTGSLLSNTSAPAHAVPTTIYSPAGATGPTVNLGGFAATGGSVTNGLTGNNIPVSIMPPFLGMTTILSLSGIFPSRG